MNLSIKVKSSSSDQIYTVTLKKFNDKLSLNCNCTAGEMKNLCKHRLNLISGDISSVVDSQKHIDKIHNFLTEDNINKINNELSKVDQIENDIKELKKVKKQLRKEVGRKFSDGI